MVTGLDLTDGCFAKFSLEVPGEVWMRYTKFSQVVADLLVDLWEDEIDGAALEALAEGFEFEGFERLLKGLRERNPSNDETGYREWRHALVRSL